MCLSIALTAGFSKLVGFYTLNVGSEWLLEDTIELKTGEEVTAVHLEWIPKHDAQHILALAITDMVLSNKYIRNLKQRFS